MSARSEPLLWVQLIGAGLLPLEGLLLLLLLGGSDPGPVPALERVLCWALGGLATTLLLWKRPADVWSLLLLQTPLRARRPLQQRLSRLQEGLLPRLGLVLGGALSLPLLWWLDEHAAAAGGFALLSGSPRLVLLLLAALLLSLMLWQWQQLLQALWLLSRRLEVVAATRPMAQVELEESRLCLGVPLLLLEPLSLAEVVPVASHANPPAPASPVPTGAAKAGRSLAAPPQESDGVAWVPAASDQAIPAPEPEASRSASPAAAGGPGEPSASTAEPLAAPVPTAEPVEASSAGDGLGAAPAAAEQSPVTSPSSATALSSLAQDIPAARQGTPEQSGDVSEAAAASAVPSPAVSGSSGQVPQPLEVLPDSGALDIQPDLQACEPAASPQPLDLPEHPLVQEPVPPEAPQAREPSMAREDPDGSEADLSQRVPAESTPVADPEAPDSAPWPSGRLAAGGGDSGARVAVAVEPEQTAADQQGAHLDQQIP